MPAAGSVTNQAEPPFYAEDDRVSVPKIIQIETEARTVSNVVTNNNQTPTALSDVEVFPIR